MAVTFAAGLALDGALPRPAAGEPLSWLATAATASTGLLGAAAWSLGLGKGPLTATSEVGTAFLLTAGIMSLLLLLDALDRVSRRAP